MRNCLFLLDILRLARRKCQKAEKVPTATIFAFNSFTLTSIKDLPFLI